MKTRNVRNRQWRNHYRTLKAFYDMENPSRVVITDGFIRQRAKSPRACSFWLP